MKNRYRRSIISISLSLILSCLWVSVASSQCAEPPKEPFKVGERVIADLDGPTFSVATVDGMDGDYVSLKYPDGGTGNLRTKYVAHNPASTPPCFKSGDRVVAHVEKNIWREGRIEAVTDSGATVSFVDGKRSSLKFTEIVRFPTR